MDKEGEQGRQSNVGLEVYQGREEAYQDMLLEVRWNIYLSTDNDGLGSLPCSQTLQHHFQYSCNWI